MKRNRQCGRMLSIMLVLLMVIQTAGIGILTAFADTKEYHSGERVYVGNLKVGDILEKGVILYPSTENRVGITTAEMTIDNDLFKLNSYQTEYQTDRMLRVYSTKRSVYSRNICAYTLKTYDEAEYNAQKVNKKNTHLYVGDMKVGDVVGAGSVLHTSGDGTGYTAFEAYLDGSPKKANDSYFEWSPKTPARLVSTGKDPHSPNKLILNLETFYAVGEVGSESVFGMIRFCRHVTAPLSTVIPRRTAALFI